MAVFETWLKSDLKKPVVVKHLTGVVFSQDSKANKVGVIVTDNGEPVTLSGTVYGYVIKPNGTTVEVAGVIDSEDSSRAYFVMPQEAYAVGHISIVIKLSSTGSVITTLAACTAYVYQSRKGSGVVPTGTVIPDLQTLETVIADATSATTAANTAATAANTAATNVVGAIAPPFAEATANDAGTYVTKDGKMYFLPDGHTSNATWANTTKIEVTAGGEICDLKSEINENEADIEKLFNGETVTTIGVNKLNPNEIETGKGLDQNGTVVSRNNTLVSGYIPLDTTKTSIVVTGMNAGGTARVGLPTSRICFYNSSKTFASYIDNVSSNNVTTIPQGAVYAKVEMKTDYSERSLMVEFVDSISEISSTFVQYGETTTGYYGIHGLNQAVSDMQDDLDDVEGDISDATDQIEAANASIANVYGNPAIISNLFTFQQGAVQSNGNFRSDWKYRVATPDIHDVTSDFTITIDSAYKVYVATYQANGTFIAAGWVTEPYTIRAGSRIRLCIAKVTEDTSVQADVATFCSKVTYVFSQSLFNIGNKASGNINYGLTWDWWISANSIDKFGNVYIGYVDTEGYAGVLRRQPDGMMQYKQLEKSYNDDDHNGMATIVLDDGRVLVIGAQSHAQNNKMICYRSKQPNSIDEMEKLSFEIPQGTDYIYRVTYSQIFKYDGKLFNFCRCGSYGNETVLGYACLVSDDNGSTWTAYKAITANDPYISFCLSSDDAKTIKGIIGHNPNTRPVAMLKGFTFDMSTNEFANLAGTKIGELVALNSGSMEDNDTAHYADMTDLVQQGESSKSCRLFYVGYAPKANTNFVYAISEDSTNADWVYKLYKDGTVIDIGHSGVPFGTGIYICGACFGVDNDTVYYCKATTAVADGNHELHKVKISGMSVTSDTVITEASVCILRPLFLGNGEVATAIGHYNDQTENGYNGSFTEWELKPMFVHA